MRARELLERLAVWGAAAQGAVPGLYAWGVTVVPVAWARGCPVGAKVAAILGGVTLTVGLAAERAWGERARIAALWGFVLASALVWAVAPGGIGLLRMDGARALGGMLGWALFAFTFAGPALRNRAEEGTGAVVVARSSRPGVAAGDTAYIACGAVLAALLQTVGWGVSGAERALLVRFVALAAGLAVVGAGADLALSRRAPRGAARLGGRLRRAMGALVTLGILLVAGVLLLTAD